MTNYEILPGLPPYGPPAEPFGRRNYSEGFVVRFMPEVGDAWVGNFPLGASGCCTVFEHPDGASLVVIAGGEGYVIDPISRRCITTFRGSVESTFVIREINAIVVGDETKFEAIGPAGRLWRSKRISWDGMKDLVVEGLILSGRSWDISDQWIPFRLDLTDGTFTGGSYSEPD